MVEVPNNILIFLLIVRVEVCLRTVAFVTLQLYQPLDGKTDRFIRSVLHHFEDQRLNERIYMLSHVLLYF